MNISKENLFLLLDEFGKNLLFEPEAGYDFSLDVTRKLDNIDYIKNNLDKPFTVYTDENGKQTVETLYDFIKNFVWGIDIRAGYDNNLGISKDVTIRVPKKKEIDVSWVWDKINKAQDRTSQNISKLGNQLCSKLNLPSTVARGTSFGVSIQNLYRESKADEEAKQITDFLDKHSISYRDRYSLGHWNIWIVISKEKQNLDRLEKALNTKKENMIRTMIRRKRVNEENLKQHSDWAIEDIKHDLDKLLELYQSLKPYQFNEKGIRDVIINLRAIIAYLHSAYRIESEVVTDSGLVSKNQMDEAEDEILRAKIKAEHLVDLLSGFDHKFHLNA